MNDANQCMELSTTAKKIIREFRASGESEPRYVADALQEIASNGDGAESDDFLVVCANALSEAALEFAKRVEDANASERMRLAKIRSSMGYDEGFAIGRSGTGTSGDSS